MNEGTPRSQRYHNGVSGSSADAYVAQSLPMQMLRSLSFIIKNTGANSITIRITSSMFPGAILEYEELADTEITAGSILRYFEKDQVGTVNVYIKSTLAGQPSNWSIEYSGDRL